MNQSQGLRNASLAVLSLAALLLLAPGNAGAQTYEEERPPFEIYALGSIMKTVDVTTPVSYQIQNPTLPNAFTFDSGAPGFRTGFAWNRERAALVGDFGSYHHADHTGSTSMTTFMVGPRVSSDENFRTNFYAQILAGGYRWQVQSPIADFTHGKLLLSGGAGMDVRLTHGFTLRVIELEILLAGAQNGPLTSSRVSSGLVYRFGGRK
jgi:hypothetical protein